mgnify:CR=1 FL=1
MSRRRKAAAGGGHEGPDERWLVSYADMITVLMVLFIVLYAMSQVDQNKYTALRDGLASTFGQEVASAKAPPVLDDTGDSTLAFGRSVNQSQSQESEVTREVKDQVKNQVQQVRAQDLQRTQAEAGAEADRLRDVWKRLQAALRKHGLQDDVETRIDDRGLVVSLVSRHVVFDSDRATLSARGERIVDTIAPVLRELPDRLSIDGHTNQVKVKPRYFASDWDLSVARAVTVVRRLNEVDGVPQHRMVATGAGHTRPLRDPSKPGAQEINKRVDIVILTSLTGQAKDLLAVAAHPGGAS